MTDPARIDDADMTYHAKLVERVRWAQQAQKEIADINGAFRSWGEHLHEKYELGPGGGVSEDGSIVRGSG